MERLRPQGAPNVRLMVVGLPIFTFPGTLQLSFRDILGSVRDAVPLHTGDGGGDSGSLVQQFNLA
jgi:hypothetical protein